MPLQIRFSIYFFSILLLFACKKSEGPTEGEKNAPIKNAGFELGSLQNWIIDNDKAAAAVKTNAAFGKYFMELSSGGNYTVTVSQEVSGLENGFYNLTAKIQNSGGQNACYIQASNAIGIQKLTSLPVATQTWKTVTIRGIEVTNGQLTIGIHTDAKANQWSRLDEFKLEKAEKPYTFLKGGDISQLSYIEQMGGKFFENGLEKDCIEILKNNGFNIARLRLYNDPGNAAHSPSNRLPAGIQDTGDILRLAARTKAAGMQIQLSFHYSDYWTNAGQQVKPHEWKHLNFEDLQQAVYDFTFRFMESMKQQGTTPEFVSLGNETSSGFLFPDGEYNNFPQMAALFNKAYEAVKAVSSTTQVIIHLDDAGNTDKYEWFFNTLSANGGKYDIIGASYYPFWTKKTADAIARWAVTISKKFNKEILIMETGYNFNATRADGWPGQLTDNGPYSTVYPSTPEGQKNFLLELFNEIKGIENGVVMGAIYWDPVMIEVPGVGWELNAPNVVSNTTLFDFSGNALPSLKAFKYN